MRRLFRSILGKPSQGSSELETIQRLRQQYAGLSEVELKPAALSAADLTTTIALTAVIASRVLGQDMFDTQIRGALALTRGLIAEMQTGEGKTLAATPAIVWLARERKGVHVMTANDYLAKRDAEWMSPVYEPFGLTCSHVEQGMTPERKRAAYGCDITYGTANEMGFDYLRDRIALRVEDQVHRPFHAAVIDEADSALIDEARIPLVIAAGNLDGASIAQTADGIVRGLRHGIHFTTDSAFRHANLTDAGIHLVEHWLGCGNIFEASNYALYTAVQDALHAHALLRRDIDYIVKDNTIEAVDEYKGRVAVDRRWPAGLHTAIEVKEGVRPRAQGAILGSITVENLVALYPHLCGMTGTAATQADEFQRIYGLGVEVIPTHRPVIRIDHPDRVFNSRAEKLAAVCEEVRHLHATGRPVLIGTASVEESETLSAMIRDMPHALLNARDDQAEAAIIARAGERGALTISTNMAGRGVDIRLGAGVVELGGLFVIGTNKHASRRIDHQLRGRAGRQGDPGESGFFVSLEDDLMTRNAADQPEFRNDPAGMQRFVEGQNLDARLMLNKYEAVIEGQRQRIDGIRSSILCGEEGPADQVARVAALRAVDDAWSGYLASVTELRSGVQWLSFGGRAPLNEYLQQVHEWFVELEAGLPDEIADRVEKARAGDEDPLERGAVWTYLTSDEPFGTLSERIMRGLIRKARNHSVWG